MPAGVGRGAGLDRRPRQLFIGEVLDSGFLKDEATPVLRMEDTRMNYGG